MTVETFEITGGLLGGVYGILAWIFAGLCAWWGSRHPEKKPLVWRFFAGVTLAGASLGLLALAALCPAECLRPSPLHVESGKYLFWGILAGSLTGLTLIIVGGVRRYLCKKNAGAFVFSGLIMMVVSLPLALPPPVSQMVTWAFLLPLMMGIPFWESTARARKT